MSELLDAQFKFRRMLCQLLIKIEELDLPVKIGRALCCENCSGSKSLHRSYLAIDLPMIWEDGRYGSWEDYLPLGVFWESMGGSWGGRFDLNGDGIPKDDANHFSLGYGGRR